MPEQPAISRSVCGADVNTAIRRAVIAASVLIDSEFIPEVAARTSGVPRKILEAATPLWELAKNLYRNNNLTGFDDLRIEAWLAVESVACPVCDAKAGDPCFMFHKKILEAISPLVSKKKRKQLETLAGVNFGAKYHGNQMLSDRTHAARIGLYKFELNEAGVEKDERTVEMDEGGEP